VIIFRFLLLFKQACLSRCLGCYIYPIRECLTTFMSLNKSSSNPKSCFLEKWRSLAMNPIICYTFSRKPEQLFSRQVKKTLADSRQLFSIEANVMACHQLINVLQAPSRQLDQLFSRQVKLTACNQLVTCYKLPAERLISCSPDRWRIWLVINQTTCYKSSKQLEQLFLYRWRRRLVSIS
jgi:hypothetical protein